ncbi:MAG: D-alanine--D-alanine ligase family protein [Pyrinomonadaceae bacterium]
MTKRLRVGVIFGGRSGEHEISIRSAQSVINAIDSKKYEVVPIAVTREGKWLSTPASSEKVLTEKLFDNKTARSVAIIGDPSKKGLTSFSKTAVNGNQWRKLDIVFPVLHGTYGEDGTIQGLLEMADIPYVGCGVLAASCGMDKVTLKSLFRDGGLPICRYIWFLRSEWEKEVKKVLRRVRREIGFPCFVKPANLGSSVGVSRVASGKQLVRAIDLAAAYDRKVIVEEGLDIREIECSVLGNDEPVASLPGEYVVIDKKIEFLDFTEKYGNTGNVEFVVPAKLSKELTARIQTMATHAFKAIDGAGLARVDFFLRRDNGDLLINELNTMPGFTPASGYPKMWEASGLSFNRLIEKLFELAVERHRDKSRNKTDR